MTLVDVVVTELTVTLVGVVVTELTVTLVDRRSCDLS